MLYCTGILKTGSRCVILYIQYNKSFVILYKQYKSLSAPKAPKKKNGFCNDKTRIFHCRSGVIEFSWCGVIRDSYSVILGDFRKYFGVILYKQYNISGVIL